MFKNRWFLFLIIVFLFFTGIVVILIYYLGGDLSYKLNKDEHQKNLKYEAIGKIIDIENKKDIIKIKAELIIPAPIIPNPKPANFKVFLKRIVFLEINKTVKLININLGDLKNGYLFKIITKENIFDTTQDVIVPLSLESAIKNK
ncbi:MAG: hypothetical protein AAB411_02300 [Patescibacteria group bacterium]